MPSCGASHSVKRCQMGGEGTQNRAPRGERALAEILASVIAVVERLESDVSLELALVEDGSAGDRLSADDLDRVSRTVATNLPILRKALDDLRYLQLGDTAGPVRDRAAATGIRTRST